VKRLCLAASLAAVAVFGQDSKQSPPQKPPAQQQQQAEPPEEDESEKPKEYAFNPLQAEKEMKVGEYYFKAKKAYKAAAYRFREATRWNPTLAEAFLRLGEAEEKLHDMDAAHAAYSRYLELEPTGKEADAVKKKLAGKR
jgi:tetratricopeptide (TPR) repeat protein